MNIKVNKLLNESFKKVVRSIGNILLNDSFLDITFNKLVKKFKELKISKEETDSQFIDYSEIFESRRYGSEMCYIFETIETKSIDEINTIATKEVIKTLNDVYGMKEWQLTPIMQNGVPVVIGELNLTDLIVIQIIIPNLKDNLEIIEREMNKVGYFLSRTTLMIKNGKPYNIVMFNPLHQDSVKEYIKKNLKFIYHCNVAYHDVDVVKYGFVPRAATDKREFMYPERIFFMGSALNNELKTMMSTLAMNNMNPKNNGDYILYQLSTVNIPDDIEFYKDPNFPDCFYSTLTIPYSAVVYKEYIKLK